MPSLVLKRVKCAVSFPREGFKTFRLLDIPWEGGSSLPTVEDLVVVRGPLPHGACVTQAHHDLEEAPDAVVGLAPAWISACLGSPGA